MTKRTLTPAGKVLLRLADYLTELAALQAKVCEPHEPDSDDGWTSMYAPLEDIEKLAEGIREAARICRSLTDEPLTQAEDEV